MAANRYYAEVSRDPQRKAEDILNSLELLTGLKKHAPQQLEIRTIYSPLTFGAICIDPDQPTGKLYIEHFNYRSAADAQPKFVLSASEKYWYEIFRKEIRALWDGGVEWQGKGSEDAIIRR
jgi:hypothetical protein